MHRPSPTWWPVHSSSSYGAGCRSRCRGAAPLRSCRSAAADNDPEHVQAHVARELTAGPCDRDWDDATTSCNATSPPPVPTRCGWPTSPSTHQTGHPTPRAHGRW